MPHYHGRSADYSGAIELNEFIEYDLCPRCQYRLKQASSSVCLICAAQMRAIEQEREYNERSEALRTEWHAFYRERMESDGWTVLDCWRHAQEQREKRGDPVAPRFWTGKSIGRVRNL